MTANRYKNILIAALAIACCSGQSRLLGQEAKPQFYELRIYHVGNEEKQSLVRDYLEQAYLPALHRLGIENVGVFSVAKPSDDLSLFMLIPYQDLETFANLGSRLARDNQYQRDAKRHVDIPIKDPEFQRIESRLLKAFTGMPELAPPDLTKKKASRIFELRLYESHTEDHARRKITMFNEGEIQLMREVQLGPVFFGETLIGPDVPNLVYMLSAESVAQHESHWGAFLAHPAWEEMKNQERYKDTVSKIRNWFLVPEKYSDL